MKIPVAAGDPNGAEDYRRRVEEAQLPDDVREAALTEVSKLERIGDHSPESGDIRNWLDTILELPWSTKAGDWIDLQGSHEVEATLRSLIKPATGDSDTAEAEPAVAEVAGTAEAAEDRPAEVEPAAAEVAEGGHAEAEPAVVEPPITEVAEGGPAEAAEASTAEVAEDSPADAEVAVAEVAEDGTAEVAEGGTAEAAEDGPAEVAEDSPADAEAAVAEVEEDGTADKAEGGTAEKAEGGTAEAAEDGTAEVSEGGTPELEPAAAEAAKNGAAATGPLDDDTVEIAGVSAAVSGNQQVSPEPPKQQVVESEPAQTPAKKRRVRSLALTVSVLVALLISGLLFAASRDGRVRAQSIPTVTATATAPVSAPTTKPSDASTQAGGNDATIQLVDYPNSAKPFETVPIHGQYRGGGDTFVQAQRREEGKWIAFPLPTKTDQSGEFTAYVELWQPGRYRLRVVDPRTGLTSQTFVLVVQN